MDTDRIRTLRRLLPNPAPSGNPGHAGVSFAKDVSGYSRWEDRPDFGYQFIGELLKAREDLPAAVTEKWLVRLYRMERYKFYNPHVAEAISWREPARRKYRHVVEGLLICQDAPLDVVAEYTNLDKHTVECYEQLFFNVKDRIEDNVYLSNLAYPRGVACQTEKDYFTKTDPGVLLLRVGFSRGFEDVLFFAGLRGHEGAGVDATAQLEDTIMTEALAYARNGGLSQRGLPQISSAKAILVAQKSGGENERPPDPTGLSDMGAIIRSTMMGRARSNVQKVLDNRNDAVDVEADEISLQKD